MDYVIPVLVGVVYVFLNSFIPEPHRLRFNAIMIAGAGAAYLSSGGVGMGELPFTAVMTFVAYRALTSYMFVGIGWLLHTGWDIVHHLKGTPILPELSHSSLGCAICDPVIALWAFAGGPSLTSSRR
jgi:hypothetical protein